MSATLRHLALCLAVLWTAPQVTSVIFAVETCGEDCPEEEEALPCFPLCGSCLCSPHSPRISSQVPHLQPPTWSRAGARFERAASEIPDRPWPGIFHPPRG